MKLTSAQAAKMLRRLNESLSTVYRKEMQGRSFLASLGEEVESVRPEYNFDDAQREKRELEEKIRRLKHAINYFNCTTVVPGFSMTVDQMLVFIPQLGERLRSLSEMKNALPKTRVTAAGFGTTSAVIDYRYANYEIADAEQEYDEVAEMLANAQLALDNLNNTVEFDADVD